MSTPAGWYDDPSHPGRLRYWDANDWTEWVNENGETRAEPLGAPPAQPTSATATHHVVDTPPGHASAPTPVADAATPTPGIQPAPAWDETPAATPATTPAWDNTPAVGTAPALVQSSGSRLGFGLIGLGGLVSFAGIGQAATRAKVTDAVGFDVGPVPIIAGLGLVVGAVLGLVVKNVWSRAVGLLITATALLFAAFFLIGSRANNDKQYLATTEIVIKPGWWILFAGAAVALVGSLLAAASADKVTAAPTSSSKPVVGLVTALVGLAIWPLTIFGAYVGGVGAAEGAASGGRIKGGTGTAAKIVGLILYLLIVGGFLTWSLFALPDNTSFTSK